MKSVSETTVNRSVECLDLAAWLSTLSDREYQACSRGHRAAGTFREGEMLGMVNVESVGGNLLVQHYLMVKAAANPRMPALLQVLSNLALLPFFLRRHVFLPAWKSPADLQFPAVRLSTSARKMLLSWWAACVAQRRREMLHWSVVFLVIALIAALLGFGGIAGAAAGMAKILFFVFLVVWLVAFLFGRKAV